MPATLTPITPHGIINDDDVAEVLAALERGQTYLFTDLLERYQRVAKKRRRQPASPLMLGKALVAAGCVPRRHQRSKRSYLIP